MQLNRLPAGSMPWQQHLTRSALSIIVPIATFAMYIVFGKVRRERCQAGRTKCHTFSVMMLAKGCQAAAAPSSLQRLWGVTALLKKGGPGRYQYALANSPLQCDSPKNDYRFACASRLLLFDGGVASLTRPCLSMPSIRLWARAPWPFID